jgi:carboxyl-terminal processing protease
MQDVERVVPSAKFQKGMRAVQILLAVLILLSGGAVGGYMFAYSRLGVASGADAAHSKVQFSTFWKAWDVINDNFFGTADATKQVDGAISGMVASLGDPYTLYFDPKQDKLFRSDLQGSFSGIGAELAMDKGNLTVESVLEGSPALKANVQPKDIITEIDGSKVVSSDFADAIDKIRGPIGSKVVLTIIRAGEKADLKISVTRDTITVKSVTTDTLGTNKDVAYVKVNQFGQDTTALYKDALTAAAQSDKKALIIDLRNNPGGYLSSAADMIGMLLPDKIDSSEQKLKDRVAVLERDKKGNENPYKSTTAPILPTIPTVVLVNANSASASEIFAGAMKDYKRATVLGVKTFGKGSVQNLIKLDNGGSIKVTIAKWFTPLGVGIDKKGIDPDVVVALPDGVTPSTTDVQVQKALELLGK